MAQQTIRVPQDASTIQGGIDAASNGDTVLVAPGTYNENIDFHGKNITVTSGAANFTDAATTSTIINGTQDGPVVTFDSGETSGAVLNGFTIQNGHSSAGATLPAAGVWISGASPTISNNLITNNTGNGILLTNLGNASVQSNSLVQGNDISDTTTVPSTGVPGGDGNGLAVSTLGNIQVIGNIIENNTANTTDNNGGSPGGGVSITGFVLGQTFSLLLKNNIIRNNRANQGSGIFQADTFSPPNLSLVQNLIYDNTYLQPSADGSYYGQQVDIGGSSQPPYPSLTEINNTIYGPGNVQELLFTFATSIIDNNIFFNPVSGVGAGTFPDEESGLSCGDSFATDSPITISNNDIYNAGQLQDGGCKLGNHNDAADPQFLNVSGNDFHTRPTSPVVAAGTVSAPDIPSADLDAKAREVCNTIDLGVYEVRPHPPILLTITPNPAPGQSTVTLTATVTGNCNTPTGTITFLDGTTVLGSALLNSAGVATFSTSFLYVGTHNLVATYPGDFNFENSTSNTVVEVITGPPTATILNSVMPNPAQLGQGIAVTATVSSAYTVPIGAVTFAAGGTVFATSSVGSNGVASSVAAGLHAGTYTVTASYGGSTEYATSTSNSITLTVTKANTMILVTASPNPAGPSQTIILTAQVSGSVTGIPLGGTVTFTEAGATLGTGTVGSNGVARVNVSGLLTGTHAISATFSGSADYVASASQPLTVTVTAISTSLGLNVSPIPANLGQSVTVIATAISTLPNQVPTGTVTFSDEAAVLGTTPLVAGVASLSTTALTVGSHHIIATLNPTGFFASSTSAIVTETVDSFNFSISINGELLTPPTDPSGSIQLTLPSGGWTKLNVVVTPSGGFTDAVQLGCSTVPIHAQCDFSSETTKPLSKGVQTEQIIINTSDVLGYGPQVSIAGRPPFGINTRATRLAGLWLPFTALLGLYGAFSRHHRRRLCHLLMLLFLSGAAFGLMACSGRPPGETPPGAYTIVLTGTDAGSQTSITRSLNLQLIVTPRR